MGTSQVSKPTIELVREFHQAFNHNISNYPVPCSKKLRELRAKLIAEELMEYCQAAGVEMRFEVPPRGVNPDMQHIDVAAYAEENEVDVVGIADALGDLDYVVQGANLVHGIPGGEVVAEIHRANMSKLGADGKPIHREDGKVIKGPNYTPPNISSIINRGAE